MHVAALFCLPAKGSVLRAYVLTLASVPSSSLRSRDGQQLHTCGQNEVPKKYLQLMKGSWHTEAFVNGTYC